MIVRSALETEESSDGARSNANFRTVTDQEMAPEGAPMTNQAADAWRAAGAAAQHWGHDYLGTEHLLIGLVAEPTSPAAKLLAHHGITPTVVRQHIETLVQQSEPA